VPVLASVGGESTCFEDAHGPEPFVQSHG
jgi:hypothetical protein